MLKNNDFFHLKTALALLFLAVICRAAAGTERTDWKRQEVDLRISGGSRIKAISYPQDKSRSLFGKRVSNRQRALRKKTITVTADSQLTPLAPGSTISVVANVIDSPPIAGFVPWIVVSATDARLGVWEIDAVPTTSVIGDYLPGSNPQSDYAIGLYDTGAGANLMGDVAAMKGGLFGLFPYYYPYPYITENMIEIYGATGSRAYVWVSQPIGLFVDGLGALDPNGLLFDNSGMVGETNVSILVGDPYDSPNLPTAIGSPMSVYFTASFRNDRQITIFHENNQFTAPDAHFYGSYDPCIPNYSNTIFLELRPIGATSVQYIFDPFDPEYSPFSPSIILAGLTGQSLFFADRTDLAHNNRTSTQKKFMVDTGAQISVISGAQATEVGINKSDPNFWVEVTDVTGDTIDAKGFIIDLFEISADPEWLSFTDVPVVMLDVMSPEGGTLDGIIGMNLFLEFNLVFRGGGLPDYGGHTLEFEPIDYRAVCDIAPGDGDGKINNLDLAAFVKAWLATPNSSNWNPRADLSPAVRDGRVDFNDFAVLAEFGGQ
ncbi:MAG: aspartyl protease family protein [Planctomycetota bacterium]|jgi:hypothetical protein